MLDATTRSGGTATASPRAAATEHSVAVATPPPVSIAAPGAPASPVPSVEPVPARAFVEPVQAPASVVPAPDAPAVVPDGPLAHCSRALLSPWSRLTLLVVLLAAAGTSVLLFEPQRLLEDGWPPQLGGAAAAVAFAVAYGLCTVAFVPRPLLNLAAGAVFGSQLGLASALAGTVLGAGVAFGLGRVLGQDALRRLLRGRWLTAADGQLSRHGFRSMMAARLFPGVPFWAANYCAAVSRMGWPAFLLATALGSVPNTAAYAVAGARASAPTSPAFLVALAFIAVPAVAGAVLAWRKRHHLRGL